MIIVEDLGTVTEAFILSEININKDMTTPFSISGYERFCFYEICGRGGGTCAYVKGSLCTSQIEITMMHSEYLGL